MGDQIGKQQRYSSKERVLNIAPSYPEGPKLPYTFYLPNDLIGPRDPFGLTVDWDGANLPGHDGQTTTSFR